MKHVTPRPFGTHVLAVTLALATAVSGSPVAYADIDFNDGNGVQTSYKSETLTHENNTTSMNNYTGGGFALSGGDQTINVTGTNNVEGAITSADNTTIQGGGELNVSNGDGSQQGIYLNSEDVTKTTDLTIDGTTVNVNVSVDADAEDNYAQGIAVYNGDINIKNAEVNVNAKADLYSEAVSAAGGDINITDSKVTAEAKANAGGSNGIIAVGLKIDKNSGMKGGDINITSSDVKASGDIAAITAYTLSNSENAEGQGKINLVNSTIETPKGGKVQDLRITLDGAVTETRSGQTIGTGDGVIDSYASEDFAKSVVIKNTKNTAKASTGHVVASKLPSTGDATVNPAVVSVIAAMLVGVGFVVSRRRVQE